jgi:hypothetical protein
MSLKNNIISIWKNKGQIIEGITNSVFKREDVEEIAEERMRICRLCPSDLYDESGDGCMIPGTAPCCNQLKGGCGCSLGIKTRSLSSSCPKNYWDAELSQQEEDQLNLKLAL